MAIFIAPKDGCPYRGRLCYLAGDVGRGDVYPLSHLNRSNQMAIKARSRREKVGSGLGLLLGIIGFNLLVPFFFEKQVGFDGGQMLWAAVTALLCSELGARVGKWLDRREQS
ncbi:hypothetical protein CF141_09780 [Aeromonas hydrophila]|nr:hypothetical protein CF141_09780 [Aeromonas hydrophila]